MVQRNERRKGRDSHASGVLVLIPPIRDSPMRFGKEKRKQKLLLMPRHWQAGPVPAMKRKRHQSLLSAMRGHKRRWPSASQGESPHWNPTMLASRSQTFQSLKL
uniref:Uncharacterized protein n=1 Tax=Rousettus aegyptiacus TaxID=9407 RepID=A0A7J8H2K6_ROUAE|nr:hypothetical protein HJG63_011324 [Rousettus aegyptiacus]